MMWERKEIILRVYIPILLVSLIILGLTACSQSSSEPVVVTRVVLVEGEERIVTRIVEQTLSITPTPNPMRRLVPLDVAMVGDLPDLDPQTADTDNSYDLIENLFTGLTNFNLETNLIEPELAQSWQISRDGRVWTFNLREDIYWWRPSETIGEDGMATAVAIRPVIAADVVFAIQRACSRATNTPEDFILFLIENCQAVNNVLEPTQAELDTIGVRALSNTTLQFSLTKPAAQFLTITSSWLFHPLPAELIEEFGDDWQLPENIMTSGPFLPVQWSPDRLVLHRNQSWPLPRGGNIDVVNVLLVGQSSDALTLWEAKTVDISPLSTANREEFSENNSSKTVAISNQTVFYLGFNFDSGVFREPELRLAFSAAIDRERLIEELYGGLAQPMKHITPPGVFGAPPIDQTGVGYSPDEARQWLAASGFGSCRLMPPITYLVSTADLSLRQAELIRDMWVEELGCAPEQIIIEQVPFGTKLANTRADAGANRPDVWELAWATAYPDAQNWVGDLLHCADSENRQNRPCGAVDNLIRQATQETDQVERLRLYLDIENDFFGADGVTPIIPLFVRTDYVAVQSWLSFLPASFGGEQYDTYLLDEELKRLERSR